MTMMHVTRLQVLGAVFFGIGVSDFVLIFLELCPDLYVSAVLFGFGAALVLAPLAYLEPKRKKL
jgi:hypothetical protein